MPISFEVLVCLLIGFLVVHLNRNCAVMEDGRQRKVAHLHQADTSEDTFDLASLVGRSEIVLHACVGTFGRGLGPVVLVGHVH